MVVPPGGEADDQDLWESGAATPPPPLSEEAVPFWEDMWGGGADAAGEGVLRFLRGLGATIELEGLESVGSSVSGLVGVCKTERCLSGFPMLLNFE